MLYDLRYNLIIPMKIYVTYRGKEIELSFDQEKVKVGDVFKALNLSKEYAFAVRDDELLDIKDELKDGEKIRVINAISGG